MRLYLFLLFYLISSWAVSAPYQDYIPGNALIDRLAHASFSFVAGENHRCSGVLVGEKGLALTNLHCVEECLEKSGAVARQEVVDGIFANTPVLSRPVACAAKVLHAKRNQELMMKVLRVLGPGYLSPRERLGSLTAQQKQLLQPYFDQGFEGRGDLVLVELPILNSGVSVGQADLTGAQPEPVVNLAFPFLFRAEGDNPFSRRIKITMGNKLQISNGLASQNTAFLSTVLMSGSVVESWLLNGTLLSSVDCEEGSSGSGLFNARGELIGLMRATYNMDMSRYQPWHSHAVEVSPARLAVAGLPNF